MNTNGTKMTVLLVAAALLVVSCSSGSKKENVMDGKYSLGAEQLTMNLAIPAGDGGEKTPQNFDLDRKLGPGAAVAGAPEVSGVWVGTITSNNETTDILVWMKADKGFVAADLKKYKWQITNGNLSIANPDNSISNDTPVIPATQTQLESGALTFTYTENQQTVTMEMERIVAGNSWYGLWGATPSNVPALLVPPSGYTYIALFEDDGTVWFGEVSGEGTYSTSGSSMSIEITWPPTASDENKLCEDCSNFQQTIQVGSYYLGHIQVGPGTTKGFDTVAIMSGTVLIGDETSGDPGDWNGGIISVFPGGTLTADGVSFLNMQFFEVLDGATLIIRNSTIEFARWSGCRALGAESGHYNYGFTLGIGSRLDIQNSTISATGNIPCLIAAQGNPGWFGKANQVDINIQNNTITTDGTGGIALAAGIIRDNTIIFTQEGQNYGVMAAKIENPLAGKESLEILRNTFIAPDAGRAIVFTNWIDGITYPTTILDNQFTGFPVVFSSEPDGGGFLRLYMKDLDIRGNTYTDCAQIYSPEDEFLYDTSETMGEPANLTDGPGGLGGANQITRALTDGDTDAIDFSFMSATGTANLTISFSGLSSGLKLHCVVTQYDKSTTPRVYEPVNIYDAGMAGEDWSFDLLGVDKAKTYRIELTADSGGEPVGNYTLSVSVN